MPLHESALSSGVSAGNLLIDADFGALEPHAIDALNTRLTLLPGVLETGFFVGMACKAYFGAEDGTVTSRVRPSPGLRTSL